MSIAAKESAGIFAECPKCHSSIGHGFQVCQSCGYTVSAKEQVGLQKLLAKNVVLFCVVSLLLFSGVLFLARTYFQ
jgi:uncharacterized protein (DUF983 family)